MSSAYNRRVHWILVEILLIYKRNSNGTSTVPCGTPDKTGQESLYLPSNTTCCDLSERKSLIHYNNGPLIP